MEQELLVFKVYFSGMLGIPMIDFPALGVAVDTPSVYKTSKE